MCVSFSFGRTSTTSPSTHAHTYTHLSLTHPWQMRESKGRKRRERGKGGEGTTRRSDLGSFLAPRLLYLFLPPPSPFSFLSWVSKASNLLFWSSHASICPFASLSFQRTFGRCLCGCQGRPERSWGIGVFRLPFPLPHQCSQRDTSYPRHASRRFLGPQRPLALLSDP